MCHRNYRLDEKNYLKINLSLLSLKLYNRSSVKCRTGYFVGLRSIWDVPLHIAPLRPCSTIKQKVVLVLWSTPFLVTCARIKKPLCRLVRWSVHPLLFTRKTQLMVIGLVFFIRTMFWRTFKKSDCCFLG